MGFFKSKTCDKLCIGIMFLWLMPANINFDLPSPWTHFLWLQAGLHFPPDYRRQYLQLNAVSKPQCSDTSANKDNSFRNHIC
jgi:hypothetical protein